MKSRAFNAQLRKYNQAVSAALSRVMSLGLSEMLLLGVLAFLVLGPREIPRLSRKAGRWLAELNRAKEDFQQQLAFEVNRAEAESVITEHSVPRATEMGAADFAAVIGDQANEQPEARSEAELPKAS